MTQTVGQGVRRLWNPYTKLGLAVVLDLLDATVGRIVGFGTLFDVVLTGIAYFMFGPKGLLQLWEVADPTDQIDGFVPTLTLLALAELPGRRAR
jgi:hypothetical protein